MERIYVGGIEPPRLTVQTVMSRINSALNDDFEIIRDDGKSITPKHEDNDSFFFLTARSKSDRQDVSNISDGENESENALCREKMTAFDILKKKFHNVKWRGCTLRVEMARLHFLERLEIERKERLTKEENLNKNLIHSDVEETPLIKSQIKIPRQLKIRKKHGEEAYAVDTKPLVVEDGNWKELRQVFQKQRLKRAKHFQASVAFRRLGKKKMEAGIDSTWSKGEALWGKNVEDIKSMNSKVFLNRAVHLRFDSPQEDEYDSEQEMTHHHNFNNRQKNDDNEEEDNEKSIGSTSSSSTTESDAMEVPVYCRKDGTVSREKYIWSDDEEDEESDSSHVNAIDLENKRNQEDKAFESSKDECERFGESTAATTDGLSLEQTNDKDLISNEIFSIVRVQNESDDLMSDNSPRKVNCEMNDKSEGTGMTNDEIFENITSTSKNESQVGQQKIVKVSTSDESDECLSSEKNHTQFTSPGKSLEEKNKNKDNNVLSFEDGNIDKKVDLSNKSGNNSSAYIWSDDDIDGCTSEDDEHSKEETKALNIDIPSSGQTSGDLSRSYVEKNINFESISSNDTENISSAYVWSDDDNHEDASKGEVPFDRNYEEIEDLSSTSSSSYNSCQVDFDLIEDVKSNLNVLSKIFSDMSNKKPVQIEDKRPDGKLNDNADLNASGWNTFGVMQRYNPNVLSSQDFEMKKKEIIGKDDTRKKDPENPVVTDHLEEEYVEKSNKNDLKVFVESNLDEGEVTDSNIQSNSAKDIKPMIERKNLRNQRIIAENVNELKGEQLYEQGKLESIFQQAREVDSTSLHITQVTSDSMKSRNYKDSDAEIHNTSKIKPGSFSFGFQLADEDTHEYRTEISNLTPTGNYEEYLSTTDEIEQNIQLSSSPRNLWGVILQEELLQKYENKFLEMNEGTEVMKDNEKMKYDEQSQTKWLEERHALTSDWKRKQKCILSRKKKKFKFNN